MTDLYVGPSEGMVVFSSLLAVVEMSHKTGSLCEDGSSHSTLATHVNRDENELRTLTR